MPQIRMSTVPSMRSLRPMTCMSSWSETPLFSADDPIDGRSFLPQLRGEPGHPRNWILCHYQPYWGQSPGQFARTQHYKLYRDGQYFHVPTDLVEANHLATGTAGPEGEVARNLLSTFLKQCPPAPSGNGDKNSTERPLHADWKNLLDPND